MAKVYLEMPEREHPMSNGDLSAAHRAKWD